MLGEIHQQEVPMNLPFPKEGTRQVLLPNWPPAREPNRVVGSPCWLHPGWTSLGLITSEPQSMASVFSSCAQCPEKMLLFQQPWLQIIEIDLKTCSCLSELTTAAAHLFFALKNFPPRSWHWASCLARTADRSTHRQQNRVGLDGASGRHSVHMLHLKDHEGKKTQSRGSHWL